MKKWLPLLLVLVLLCGCGNTPTEETTPSTGANQPLVEYPEVQNPVYEEIPYVSRFDTETVITLSGDTVAVQGNEAGVYTSRDIVYYEDRDTYDSGNPYGEGTTADKHSREEADAHLVVNITEPGAYRVTGQLSLGQIRIDLGADAYYDETAVVELILDNADITCTVAPAVLFVNVYECDGNWSEATATAQVDTAAAGANVILEGVNHVDGAYVAKIYKDKDGAKKQWKQDGALYSYMSMNVFGPGTLELTAANEGLDSELHLTINGGNINIRAQNDGINTNEDNVSVTTINAGTVHIIAGLGAEGDGIDSNGYLVINGGVVVSSANPAADAGLDSDLGSFVNGGIVVALGSTMDWAESDSEQVTMNLQFAQMQASSASIVVAYPDGTVAFAYDPGRDEVLGENVRQYRGAVISCPNFHVGQGYYVYLGGQIDGTETGGIYDVSTVTGFAGGTRMQYTGTDVGMGFGGGWGGQMPGGMPGGDVPQGDFQLPEDFTMPEGDFQIPEQPSMPENMPSGWGGQMPEGFDGSQVPGGMPGGNMPNGGQMPGGMPGDLPEGFDPGAMGSGWGQASQESGEANVLFLMVDPVNAFSGVGPAE